MIGLIFATHTEAKPFLEWSQAAKVNDQPFGIYQIPSKPKILVTISGMGKVCAAAACQSLIKELKITEIVNAGACGALQSEAGFEPGCLFCVTSAVEGDHQSPDGAPRTLISDGTFDWDLPPARLVTSDMPVFDDQLREEMAELGDLVDMEGAAVARVAALNRVPWSMVKGVTDTAGPGDREHLKQNLIDVSEKFCRLLWDQLRTL